MAYVAVRQSNYQKQHHQTPEQGWKDEWKALKVKVKELDDIAATTTTTTTTTTTAHTTTIAAIAAPPTTTTVDLAAP